MAFLDDDAGEFDFVLTLDADSVMSADMVCRLVRIMQADPGMAILQANIASGGAATVFSHMLGIGHLHRARTWTVGQGWWQGPAGPYWGHNALLRIKPFRQHARLPLLPDGRRILSHDHVEAALLQGAGWATRVLPEDAGSAEKQPPDMIALLQRVRGNLSRIVDR